MGRVLGVDPGLSETGWALLSTGEGPAGAGLLGSGLIATPAGAPLGQRLRSIHEGVAALLRSHRPDALALEQLFFMRSTRSIAATSQARGVILLASEQAACPVSEYNPRDVKMSLTGNGGALKPQMQRMVKMLLGLKEELRPDDVADAAAIALCHLRTQRFKSRIAG